MLRFPFAVRKGLLGFLPHFPFAVRKGLARLPSSLPAAREPDPLPTDPAAAEPSPAPSRTAALTKTGSTAPELWGDACQGQINAPQPLATWKTACQGQRGHFLPLAERESGRQGRRQVFAPLGRPTGLSPAKVGNKDAVLTISVGGRCFPQDGFRPVGNTDVPQGSSVECHCFPITPSTTFFCVRKWLWSEATGVTRGESPSDIAAAASPCLVPKSGSRSEATRGGLEETSSSHSGSDISLFRAHKWARKRERLLAPLPKNQLLTVSIQDIV